MLCFSHQLVQAHVMCNTCIFSSGLVSIMYALNANCIIAEVCHKIVCYIYYGWNCNSYIIILNIPYFFLSQIRAVVHLFWFMGGSCTFVLLNILLDWWTMYRISILLFHLFICCFWWVFLLLKSQPKLTGIFAENIINLVCDSPKALYNVISLQ